MTNFTPPAAGTESSVPVAAPPQGSDANAVAAFQWFSNALASLNPVSQIPPTPAAAVKVAAQTPAPPIPVAPVPVVPAPASIPAAPAFHIRGPWVAGRLYYVVPTGPLMPIPEEATDDEEEVIWYCITKGRHIGVTVSNGLAVAAVVNLRGGGVMKRYKGQALALAAFNEMLAFPGLVSVIV